MGGDHTSSVLWWVLYI